MCPGGPTLVVSKRAERYPYHPTVDTNRVIGHYKLGKGFLTILFCDDMGPIFISLEYPTLWRYIYGNRLSKRDRCGHKKPSSEKDPARLSRTGCCMRKVLFILGQLSDIDVEWMLSVGKKERITPGSVLIVEGKPLDSVYLVLDGKLSVFVTALSNKELAVLGSGEIVGEMSFVDSRPPSATVKALEETTLFTIPRSALASKLQKDVGFASRFYHALALFLSDRLRSTVSRLGFGQDTSLDEAAEYEDELDPLILDTVHLAGSRFDRMLKRLMGNQ